MFARWGRFVYRRRWITLAGSLVLLAATAFLALRGGTLAGNGSFGAQLPAGAAARLVSDEIHAQATPAGSGMTLLFSSPDLVATDAAFEASLEGALEPLKSDAHVASVTTPYSVPAGDRANLISRDGHEAIVDVRFKDRSNVAQRYYQDVVAEVHPAGLRVVATGQVPINAAFNSTLDSDLQRAELFALPVTLLMLVLIFAAVVAAALPLGVGLLAIVGGLGGTLFLARFTDVSQYAINVVTLIGLAVAIDYSLFIVNRFRDELAAGASREDAIAITMSTAGRAITFSGVTVAIGLSAMLFFQGTFMASLGAAGGIVVAIAVVYGLTFLPALLSVLGPRIDRLRVPFLGRRPADGTGAWHTMAMWVMKRPVLVLVPALAALVVAGTPFTQLRLANADVDVLPPGNAARQAYDSILQDFPGRDQTDVTAVVYYPGASPLTEEHVGAIYDLSRRFAAMPAVLRVQSIVDLAPTITREQYQALYSGPRGQLPQAMQQALAFGAGPHVVLLDLVTNQAAESDAARNLVRAVRSQHVDGGQVLATGETAFDLDIVDFIVGRTPSAVGAVIAVTYFVLFLLTGSVVLPLKAVITNLFSISASFGALVFVFQDGHFSELLGFTPQSIDPSIPVILFSIVFGMSMDYEVLLISRIQEEYRRTGDNQRGVALGLEKSGRLITGAAAIMCVVFVAFGLADVLIIKSIGLGLAVAIAIDATAVRILIVPSVMRILGRANWWAPAPLAALHRRLGAAEAVPD
jgi:putative drug exporter of the RND superfamily